MSKYIGSTLPYAVVLEPGKITAKMKTRSNRKINTKVQEIKFINDVWKKHKHICNGAPFPNRLDNTDEPAMKNWALLCFPEGSIEIFCKRCGGGFKNIAVESLIGKKKYRLKSRLLMILKKKPKMAQVVNLKTTPNTRLSRYWRI